MTEEEGEIVVEETDMNIEEEMTEEMPPAIPITGTALIVPRFIVTGDTEIELEVLPVDLEIDADAENAAE